MLQKLRDQTQSLIFKVIVGAIIFTLAIFGFGAFNLFVTADPAAGSVNGEDISQTMLMLEADRERRRMAARMGENFDPALIDPIRLQNLVLEQLIGRELLSQAADDLSMGPSPRQVDRSIVENPNFQIDGLFEQNTYRRMVQMMGYTPVTFMEVTGKLLALDQLRTGVVASSILTDWEMREYSKLLSQKRDIAYLPFTVAQFSPTIVVSDEDIALRYEENERTFLTEESVDLEYVELAASSLLDDPSIEVTEADIETAYLVDKAANPPEEKRAARHILIEVTQERSAEDAALEIEALRARIQAGESFAELAETVSEDPGSAAQGGDLGLLGKGVFVPEFERALWSLSAGELSEPVRTEFGYHLIELTDIVVTEFPSFEEQREEIAGRLRRDQAESLFLDRFREMDNLAFEQSDSLEGLVETLGLEIKTVEAVTRNVGTGVFGNVELRNAVFADEVLVSGYNSSAVQYVDNRAIVARVAARHEPEVKPLAEVQDEIRAELVAERARVKAREAHTAALARIEAGESVAEVARDYDVEWLTFELARRNEPGLPREVLQTAFALPKPVESDKAVGTAGDSLDAIYVVTVTRVQNGEMATMTESEIAGLRNLLADRASGVDFEGLYKTLEADASISRFN